MKTQYKQDLNETFLQVEMPCFYEEDYQIPMLQVNKIEGLLPMTSKGIDKISQYSYDVSGLTSMKTQYETMKFEREDMENFIQQLVSVIGNIKNYMLDGKKLLLAPEYIFCKNDRFYFCYLPVKRKGKTFHELTEYFVSQVNYEKTDAVRLAVELHKASMEENYDIEQILEEFHNKEQAEQSDVEPEERGNIFELEDEESDDLSTGRNYADVETLREMNGTIGWIKRNLKRKKREKWGVWEGLVTEDEFMDV